MKTKIDAALAALALLALIAGLGYAMAITLERDQPTTVRLAPASPTPAPIDPEVQRLIDEVRKLTQAPSLQRLPYSTERKDDKVVM